MVGIAWSMTRKTKYNLLLCKIKKSLHISEGTEKLIIKLGLVQSCLYKPFSLGYLRNNKQFGSDKQFSERLFRIYPSILSPIFSKGTFSVPSHFGKAFLLNAFYSAILKETLQLTP
jgi:hypothetical protein